MDESRDPSEDNEIVQIWGQLDETTTAYVGFSLLNIVVCFILLCTLGCLINRIFPNSLVQEIAAGISSPPEMKKVIETNGQVNASFSTKKPESQIREHVNNKAKLALGQETPQSQPLQHDTSWIGELTEEQLLDYTASKKSSRLHVAVEGVILDVTESRDLYGEGNPYEKFAGRHVSRALTKWSVALCDFTGDNRNPSTSELTTLENYL